MKNKGKLSQYLIKLVKDGSLKQLIFAFVKSSLFSLALYAGSLIFLAASTEGQTRDERDVVAGICNLFFFAIAFYICYIRKKNEEYEMNVKITDGFSFKKESTTYFFEDGIKCLVILIPLAVIFEAYYITNSIYGFVIPFMAALFFIFPLVETVFFVPILGTFFSILAFLVLTTLLAVFSRYRMYQKWSVRR